MLTLRPNRRKREITRRSAQSRVAGNFQGLTVSDIGNTLILMEDIE